VILFTLMLLPHIIDKLLATGGVTRIQGTGINPFGPSMGCGREPGRSRYGRVTRLSLRFKAFRLERKDGAPLSTTKRAKLTSPSPFPPTPAHLRAARELQALGAARS
jgi:hypothetical protein